MRTSIALAVLLAAAAGPCAAFGGDTGDAGCARIVDVDLPYEVDVDADALRFEDGDDAIVVAVDRIEVDGRVFRGPGVRAYHDDLRGFLDNAGSMARVARSFTRRGAFPQAATDMCRAILAVQASGNAMEQRFPGFANPVRVVLE